MPSKKPSSRCWPTPMFARVTSAAMPAPGMWERSSPPKFRPWQRFGETSPLTCRPTPQNRQVIALQFRDQNTGLCAERGWNVPDALVVVSIMLLKHVEEFRSRKIDALALAVVCHVVDHGRGRVTCYDLA